MNLAEMADDDLIGLATGDTSAYKDAFLQSIRIELYGRGFIFKEKHWQKTGDADPLREIMAQLKGFELRLASLEKRVPDTQVLSSNFTNRAFAIFGHALVANLLVAAPILLLTWIFS
jgi:hypothetical protein